MMVKCLMSVFICCLISACVQYSIAVKEIDSVPESERLVFGEILAKNVKPGTHYSLFIQEDNSEQEYGVRCVKDKIGEKFSWRLRPGRYTITTFQIHNGAGRIWVKFDVPDECDAVYIGKLEMYMSTVSYIQVIDDMATAEAALREKLPSNDYVVVKQLMQKGIER